MINNLVVDIVENSYGKDHIKMSSEAFIDLKTAKKENYLLIYGSPKANTSYDDVIKPMFKELYYKLLKDVIAKDESSIVYRHHIAYLMEGMKYYSDSFDYTDEEPNQIVADYMSSMTDDYFVELHKLLFPDSKYRIEYTSYFI